MDHSLAAAPAKRLSRPMSVVLWAVQGLLFAAFVTFGGMKLLMPVDNLAAMWIWPGQVPEWFLRTLGLVDVAGGVGLLLPSLTRIRPQLTVLAAFCCIALQVAAIVFHLSRGEAVAVPLNIILLTLLAFVAWGRTKSPVTARG